MDREYSALVVMHCVMMIAGCLAMEPTIETDQSALLALKSFITSDPHQILSKNWSSSAPTSSVCGWTGVQCGHRNLRVTALNVSGWALTGIIPPHLGNLSFLVSLDMSRNYFHGTLPQELSRLRRLTSIRLSHNNITGTVPTWFGPKLQVLVLSDNDFDGVIPSSISNLSNLETLNLQRNSLTGNIPQEIGNLQGLTILSLQFNFLVGSIPSSIFNISTLETLALSSNNLTGSLPNDICHHLPNLQEIYLSNNQLSGPIPPSLSRCSQLQVLSLATNNFSGFIPKELSNLEMMEALRLKENNLQGSIPEEVGNLTNLAILDLTANFLEGTIPEGISSLQKLEYIYTDRNQLYGPIPIGIFNISTLIQVDFSVNQLTAILPSDICHQLPNIEQLALYENNISGVIPASMGNCSRLLYLDLSSNQMFGAIPKSLGNLESINMLVLFSNQFTGDPTSQELDFLTSLTQSQSLVTLVLDENPLNGTLPNSMGNHSSSLQSFYAASANIRGPIPSEIGNLTSLISISLDGNQLTGAIPDSIQGLETLQELTLEQNQLGGTLDKFCYLPSLSRLSLSGNQVSGPIPDCFGNITSLRNLFLRSNLLTLSFPKSLCKLKDVLSLDLASNSFNGSLPVEIGNLKAAVSIDLSSNQISGVIPSTLDGLQNLQNFSLANNQLEGSIPESFGKMLSLISLNLSHNNLSGFIPMSLEAVTSLMIFDVSSNHLMGEIPSEGPFKNFTSISFMNNDALCGDPKFQVPPCKTKINQRSHKKKMILFILIPLALFVLVILAFAYIFLRYRNKSKVPSGIDLPITERISYYELLQATNGLNESNLLGSGGFGSVYKGILKDGKVVAVKVFHLQREGSLKSFDRECEVFCNLRHRNLVKVFSSCSNEDFKALVLEYMPNGSLETWLHCDSHFLDILQRLDIMIDVASALRYLHHEYSTPVIHCDLKPSNILIDGDMVARVSDFGIAKFLTKDESMALTKTFATIGYIAPEYGREGLVSKACDVFSYGILLMEVFTGRRPNDEIFSDNMNLKSWVSGSIPDSIVEVIDPKLLMEDDKGSKSNEQMLGCVSMIMELALNCVPESPKERLKMNEVVDSLKKIKDKYVVDHGIYH